MMRFLALLDNPATTRVMVAFGLAPDMRALQPSRRLAAIALVGIFLTTALAGCLTAGIDDGLTPAAAQLGVVDVPAGATLVEEAHAVILRFTDVALPFEQKVVIPEGATLVRTTALAADAIAVRATMFNDETGRRRCNTSSVDAWNLPLLGENTCSGIALIDPPGATWVVRVSGPVAAVVTVDVAFETTPLDGALARLDLSQLSMPVHDLLPTEILKVPSFDGTILHVEVTLPEGEGPWPTVIASSPYNGQYGRGADAPAMWTYFTHDWAKRGYAIVNADVRGFGLSGGCVEVWGENEQKDQAFLVDWAAEQEWSDGRIGFYGQSYVGTTPVAAAVQNPAALKAIIAVAPVISAYDDWHYGGVPNGENALSPVAYQVLTDPPATTPDGLLDPLTLAHNNLKGVCDPTLVVRANDPRALYDAFYEERNFSQRAAGVQAAVLYTQGFEDLNVKSAMITHWFNELPGPKLGLFGHWLHQHPTRADEEILFLGWMDQYVKEKPLGLDTWAAVEVVANDGLHREAAAWPPLDAETMAFATDFTGGRMGEGADGGGMLLLATGGAPANPVGSSRYELTMPIEAPLALAGSARLAIEGMLMNGGNAYFHAELRDDGPDGSALVTYGMFNLAHRNGHDAYAPAAPSETVTFELPFLPTEWVFKEGHTLRVVLSGAGERAFVPGQPGAFMLHGGEASQLLLPTVDASLYGAAPATATR